MTHSKRSSLGTRIAQLSGVAIASLGIVAATRIQSHGSPADPTFADDVAPIFYKNCAPCHHPGGMGPFSLLNYDTAVAHIDQMRGAVSEGDMPPWHAAGPRGVFLNDRRLSDADKQTIVRWIDNGAKSGDLAHQPPKPDFPSTWMMGEPDAAIAMPDSFNVPAEGKVDYQYFQVPTNFTEDKWVQAIEVKPSAREVVHHVLVYAYAPPVRPISGSPAAPQGSAGAGAGPTIQQRPAGAAAPQPLLIRNREQSQTPPDAPRDDSVHSPPRMIGAVIGVYTPGTNGIVFPAGTALRVRPGTILTFQMHYTAHGHAMTDRTQIGFHFAKAPPENEVFVASFINGSFTIPAGAKDVAVPSEIGVGQPIRIWGIMPHTHLRGTRWQYTLVKPDSTKQVVLDVPHYDFNWQTYYMYSTPIEIEPGTKLEAMAWYDNSATNKSNPDPTADVHWGEQTWNEMQYTSIIFSRVNKPQ